MYRWILDPAERYAVLANVAIKSINKDYHVIVEIASVLQPQELLAVRHAYQHRYKHSLEEHVAAYTSGYHRQASQFFTIHYTLFLLHIYFSIICLRFFK
jgi:annexin D